MISLPPQLWEPTVKKRDGQLFIFDSIRKKYLVLSPEEWVRQSLVHYLLHQKNYPSALFSLEKGLRYVNKQKRSDLVVYDRETRPFLLIECKAPYLELSPEHLNQVITYNKVLQAPYFGICNGHTCLLYARTREEGAWEVQEDFPEYLAD